MSEKNISEDIRITPLNGKSKSESSSKCQTINNLMSFSASVVVKISVISASIVLNVCGEIKHIYKTFEYGIFILSLIGNSIKINAPPGIINLFNMIFPHPYSILCFKIIQFLKNYLHVTSRSFSFKEAK